MSTAVTVYEPRIEDEEKRLALQQREGKVLASSHWTPKHLIMENYEETLATCVGIVQMANKWNMSPSMVAGETYSVHGKIGFQGKLYAALANAHGDLEGGLRVIYAGSGAKMAAVVFGSSGPLTEDDAERLLKFVESDDSAAASRLELAGVKAIRLTVEACKTDNKMWTTDPKQKIFYSGATKWCRRYMPDLILGAISVEDIERIEYEKRAPEQAEPPRGIEGVKAKLKIGQQPEPQESTPEQTPEPTQAPEPEFTLGKQPGDMDSSRRHIAACTTRVAVDKALAAELSEFNYSDEQRDALSDYASQFASTLKK